MIEISEYTDQELDGYYYDYIDERILKVQNNSRIKIINPTINGELIVINLRNIHGKQFQRSYNKLIRTMKDLVSS